MALENKLRLTSSADLAREEERISKKKAVELFESGVLDTLPAGIATVKRIMKSLQDKNYIRRESGKRYGKWEVLV